MSAPKVIELAIAGGHNRRYDRRNGTVLTMGEGPSRLGSTAFKPGPFPNSLPTRTSTPARGTPRKERGSQQGPCLNTAPPVPKFVTPIVTASVTLLHAPAQKSPKIFQVFPVAENRVVVYEPTELDVYEPAPEILPEQLPATLAEERTGLVPLPAYEVADIFKRRYLVFFEGLGFAQVGGEPYEIDLRAFIEQGAL